MILKIIGHAQKCITMLKVLSMLRKVLQVPFPDWLNRILQLEHVIKKKLQSSHRYATSYCCSSRSMQQYTCMHKGVSCRPKLNLGSSSTCYWLNRCVSLHRGHLLKSRNTLTCLVDLQACARCDELSVVLEFERGLPTCQYSKFSFLDPTGGNLKTNVISTL